MHGSILTCMEEMALAEMGQPKWQQALGLSGLPAKTKMFPHKAVEDAVFFKLLDNVCQVSGLGLEAVAERFGQYWMRFAAKHYFAFFMSYRDARSFLLGMPSVHKLVTQRMPGATPPRFSFEERADGGLAMGYHSERGLQPLWKGLIRAVGQHFGERLETRELDASTMLIHFRGKLA